MYGLLAGDNTFKGQKVLSKKAMLLLPTDVLTGRGFLVRRNDNSQRLWSVKNRLYSCYHNTSSKDWDQGTAVIHHSSTTLN
jgi:hypothetical protein